MGSLTVHVLDSNDNPISGKRVYCNFVGSHLLGLADSHTEEYTNDDGVSEFDDVPVGTVEVYVNGDKQIEVGVGTNDHEDVTVSI